jgi:IS1 family transposase
MSNNLPRAKQVAVVNALVEGCSMRSTSRMAGVDRETVSAIVARMGVGCATLLDETMRNLPCTRLELDELWAFVGKKQRHVSETDDPRAVGDTWTWVATCADTKLVPAFHVGKRTEADADVFISDLASRIRDRVQISTDGLGSYIGAIARSFGARADFAQIVKSFEVESIGPGRYSPPKVTGTEKTPIFGSPREEFVSTSYAERNNLNVRMAVRRYTRLTNAFSKNAEMHYAATALHFAHYNFARVHTTLRVTPAMEAGVSNHVWEIDELVERALDGVGL